MARSRTILIAGGGIGGLTAALALARHGFRAVVLEQAERLDEIGAGIQLSPNASRILIELGIRDALERVVVAPEAVRILNGCTARELARTSLGEAIKVRYGAPYWVLHRGDLQAVLLEAVRSRPGIALKLGARVEDFAIHSHGVTVQVRTHSGIVEERGIALIGADGVWSTLRGRLGAGVGARFAGRTAWRALVPANRVAKEQQAPVTSLWLGPAAHLVHYPVRAGTMINIVAIVADSCRRTGWSGLGAGSEIASRFACWAPAVQALLAVAVVVRLAAPLTTAAVSPFTKPLRMSLKAGLA